MTQSMQLAATGSFRRPVRVVLALAVALLVAGVTPVGSLVPAVAAGLRVRGGVVDPGLDVGAGSVAVVVSGVPGGSVAVAEAVRRSGGVVTGELPIVDGVAAVVPGSAAGVLAGEPGVRAVTLNRRISFSALEYSESTTSSNFAKTAGATSAWAAGRLGAGVGVAVIDTGISSMNDFAGRIVHGPDLSGEGSTVDSYGHGTVMAGIIGGDGSDSAGAVGGARTGVAPRSTLVSVKVAGRNGAADVTTMLQAMHWVSAYRAQFNIRVLNLSWGMTSTQSPEVDPLNYAVQRLWREGIVVVTAAGNSGPTAGTVTKPADDPLVISVGAFNDKQDSDPSNDALSSWSSRGPTAQGLTKPDVVAPGRTLVVTRSYGSAIEVENPRALVSPSYIKGSGTSQASAVVAGLAALLLEHRPTLTPDQVKALLKGTASPMAALTGNEQGTGRVQLGAALNADAGAAVQQSATSSGLGSVEASRGGRNVETDCGNNGTIEVIRGEIDTRCEIWNGNAWTGNAWTGNAWTGNAWTGNAWTGNAWTGNAWTNATWSGNAWTGGSWTGNAWTGNAWTTATYDEDLLALPLFSSVFFGDKPKHNHRVAGEVSERPDWTCGATFTANAVTRSCGI